jgi:hypothetical protein
VKTVPASKVRKGQIARIEGVFVRVTKREKWNSKDVKLHFEDAGNGLPEAYAQIREKFFSLSCPIEVTDA